MRVLLVRKACSGHHPKGQPVSGVAGRAGPKPERISADRAVIQISRPVHVRLSKIKEAREGQLHRQVSFTEIIEQLLDRAGAA